jgi:glycosyltransferase involved in cell wall biosynthesis
MLSIIIPAHNEALRISRTLEDYTSYFLTKGSLDYEIIVVINGCRDNTEEVVSQYSKKYHNVKIHHVTGKGKGRAIKAGMRVARGDLIAFTDADGATKAVEMNKLVSHIGRNDGVIASRWLPQSVRFPRQSISRIIVSRVWNLLIRRVLGLSFRDTQCGAKLFTRTAIAVVIDDLTVDGFAFDIELLYRLNQKKRKIVEVPITWNHQDLSTLNLFHSIPDMLRDLVKIRRSITAQQRVKKSPLPETQYSVDRFLMFKNEEPLRNPKTEAEVPVP